MNVEPIACPLCRKPALMRRVQGVPFIICPCVGSGNIKLVKGAS